MVPAGEYTRYADEATGRTLVEAGSYHLVDQNPVSFFSVPALIYRAIVKAASTVTFILIIGGAFEIITSTGVLTVLCKKLSKKFIGKEMLVIPAFLVLFSIFGTTMGMSAEVMIFVPIGITLALSLGLDKVTGTTMIAMGAASGFTAGVLNPFNVGVAQSIAEIPMFSGMGYRLLILAILLAIDTVYIIWYAKRVKKDPTKSIIYGEPEALQAVDYITETLKQYGIACETERFDAYVSNPAESMLLVNGTVVPSRSRSFAACCDTVTAELVYDRGTKETVSPREQEAFFRTVRGKLVLVAHRR